MQPSYLKLSKSGELVKRAEQGLELLSSCSICPRNCGVDRTADERGFCGVGKYAEVASFGPHFGEEAPLVGRNGSGTIFFCGCNLLCVFCQNYDISHPEEGTCSPVDAKTLARLMTDLQRQGCHNINLVTPSHIVPQLLWALVYAIDEGLTVPLVYNSGGYDKLDTLHLLDGVVDIFMPDFKFWDGETSAAFMQAPDYPEVARSAIIEMQKQVGDLVVDKNGVAERGLLVRHLLMPSGMAESREIFRFLAQQVSANCYTNIMDQYHPCGKALEFHELSGSISAVHYEEMVQAARSSGLRRIDSRDFDKLMEMLSGK
ncbi:radical SAM protein [Desulfopila sp. IMCC35008]|uniref:radical SAM protein n=1 Tax=Desulfopila sp. IMCC35008 TaxID=2653858 RepID=UPI0013D7E2A4|nr:radical SAM protein [Desulfopila sp. IMCC35008]